MDNRIKFLIAFPFVFVIILFIAATYIPFKGEFTEAEHLILSFMPTELAVKEKPSFPIPGNIKSPLDFGAPGSGEKLETVREYVPGKNYIDDALSLIVISGNRKMAVIRGVIVREGDSIDGMRIDKIHPDRVLLKNKTEKWIYLEKIK